MRANKTVKWIVSVIVIVIIIAVIGLLVKLTNGFTSDVQTFYLSVNGKDIFTASGGYCISEENPLKADVKYVFAGGESADTGYFIKVVPHIVDGKDFGFTLDGDVYSFQAETDLTDGFIITRKGSSFTVKPKGDDLTDILRAVYPSYTVGECFEYVYEDMFTLLVSPYGGETQIQIHFTIPASDCVVRLDREVIVF